MYVHVVCGGGAEGISVGVFPILAIYKVQVVALAAPQQALSFYFAIRRLPTPTFFFLTVMP